GVAQPRRRVEVHEGRAPRGLGVAVGHAHDGGFLEAEHVADVVDTGQSVDEGQLGAARVAEDMGDALGAQDVEEHLSGSGHVRRPYCRDLDSWPSSTTPGRTLINTALGLMAVLLLILANAFFVAVEFALVAVDR